MLEAPLGIVIGTLFTYDLLGMRIGLWSSVIFECFFPSVSCFIGLAVTCLLLPMNHYAKKVVVGALSSYIALKYNV